MQADTLFSGNGEVLANVGKIYIGRDDYWWGGSRNFNGLMDDVRIYDYPVSALAIEELAAGGDASKMLHLTFDESSGSTMAWDASMYGKTGVLTNMAPATAWVDGMVNNALAFDGTNDHVRTPAITTPAALTVACWAKSTNSTWSNTGCLVSQRPAFVINTQKSSKKISFIIYSNPTTQVATPTWTPPASFDIRQWHHYAGVFDPATDLLALYVDGVLVTSRTTTATLNPDLGAVYVGKDDSASRYFKGSVDDVRMYSRALGWRELLELSQQLNAPPYY
jgi:hypothetical protein